MDAIIVFYVYVQSLNGSFSVAESSEQAWVH